MIAVAGMACALAVQANTYGVKLDTSAERVKTPLKVDMPRVGTLRPRSSTEIKSSNWTIGCETLDRDFAKFDEYKEFLEPRHNGTYMVNVPVYDSPCLITERSALELMK